MRKIIGWVIFTVSALIAFVCFVTGSFFFLTSFVGCKAKELAQGFGGLIAIVSVPFYFLARYGWRLSHSMPSEARAGIQVAHGYDPAERIVQIIETNDNKVLFFTHGRLIVAHVSEIGGSGIYGLDVLYDAFLALFTLGLYWHINPASRKIRRLSKLSPEEILVADGNNNFAIPYSEIIKMEFFKKMLRRKIRITAAKTLEYSLRKPWQYKKYVDALRQVLPDKLEVS